MMRVIRVVRISRVMGFMRLVWVRRVVRVIGMMWATRLMRIFGTSTRMVRIIVIIVAARPF